MIGIACFFEDKAWLFGSIFQQVGRQLQLLLHQPLYRRSAIYFKKFPFEEVYQMVLRGDITDSMSVAAILKVKLILSGLA